MRIRVLASSFGVALGLAAFGACASDPPAGPAGGADAAESSTAPGPDASPNPPTDSGADVGRSDAAVEPDADRGGDGGGDGAAERDGEAGVRSYCATLQPAPGLCEDFDDGAPSYGMQQVDPGGSIARDESVSRSAPASYRFVSATTTGLADYKHVLWKILPRSAQAPSRFVVRFAYRPDLATPVVDAGPTPTLAIVRVFLSVQHQLTLELASVDGPVLREVENAVETTTALPSVPAAGVWTEYELDVDIANKKVLLRANGGQLFVTALDGTEYDFYGANVGLSTDLSNYAVRYDDVVLDLR